MTDEGESERRSEARTPVARRSRVVATAISPYPEVVMVWSRSGFVTTRRSLMGCYMATVLMVKVLRARQSWLLLVLLSERTIPTMYWCAPIC